jgi:hypothetical protein
MAFMGTRSWWDLSASTARSSIRELKEASFRELNCLNDISFRGELLDTSYYDSATSC